MRLQSFYPAVMANSIIDTWFTSLLLRARPKGTHLSSYKTFHIKVNPLELILPQDSFTMGTMTDWYDIRATYSNNRHSDGTILSANQRKAMVIGLRKFSRPRCRLRHSLECDWFIAFSPQR